MFIEIEKDIVEDAIAKGGQDVNESRDLLIHMALCAQQGKHYVYVPCLRKCANLMEKLSQIIGSCYVRSLDYTNRDRESAQKLKKCLCVRALMTYQEMKTIDGVILINPLTNKRFEPWTETYFLVENLIDAKLYEHILEYYKKKERIGSCLVSFYPLMGGGATTSKALEQEIELGQHFCLTIADIGRNNCDFIRSLAYFEFTSNGFCSVIITA